MNKKFEAVPQEEFIRNNPDDDLTSHGYAVIDKEIYILAPIEDQWISSLPTDQECEEWYDLNIGNDPEKPCSASSGIYKFREWLKERSASSVIHKESALKFMTWYNRNEKRSELLYDRFLKETFPTSPKDTEQLKPLDK